MLMEDDYRADALSGNKIPCTNSAAWGCVNKIYFKDLSLDNNLNADSKILHVADKIWHYKTLGYLSQGEQVACSAGKKHRVIGKEKKKKEKKSPWDHDSQVMPDL